MVTQLEYLNFIVLYHLCIVQLNQTTNVLLSDIMKRYENIFLKLN